MSRNDLTRRVRRSGVSKDTLQLSISCGAYPNLEVALDRLEEEHPLGNKPDHVVVINRMIMVNNDIDEALFRLARATNAWTWLEEEKIVFILEGPAGKGVILHADLYQPVPYTLVLHQRGGTRFLRFDGDAEQERVSIEGYIQPSPFQRLSHAMGMTITGARDMFEALVRTCDDHGWDHQEFPFIYRARVLDTPHRMMRKHNYLVQDPYVTHIS